MFNCHGSCLFSGNGKLIQKEARTLPLKRVWKRYSAWCGIFWKEANATCRDSMPFDLVNLCLFVLGPDLQVNLPGRGEGEEKPGKG